MDNKPPANLPPSKRPWKLWQSLRFFTPSLVMIAGPFLAPNTASGVMNAVGISLVIVLGMCFYLAIILTATSDKGGLFWLASFIALVVVNLSIAFSGCAVIAKVIEPRQRPPAPLNKATHPAPP